MVVVAIALAAALIAGSLAWRTAVGAMRRMEARMAAERAAFEALAHEDPLTGLANKRAFDDRLDAELGRAAREYYPVALVVLDLDRFKQINDTWGHPVGDGALVRLAQHAQPRRSWRSCSGTRSSAARCSPGRACRSSRAG